MSVVVLGHVATGEPVLVVAETNDAADNVIRHIDKTADAWGIDLPECMYRVRGCMYRVRGSTIEDFGVFDEIRNTTQADDNMVDILSSMHMLEKIDLTPEITEHLQSRLSKEQRDNLHKYSTT